MSTLTKEEYLKRYLSGDGTKKKKKVRKNVKNEESKGKSNVASIRIVDDDVDLWNTQTTSNNKKSEPIANISSDEEAPAVAGIIDDRPWEVKRKELYTSDKWKTVSESTNNRLADRQDSDSDHSVKRRHDSEDESDDNCKRSRNDTDSGNSPKRRKRYDSDSDLSPPRRHDSDASPDRKNRASHKNRTKNIRNDSDSDQSPVRKNCNSDSDQSPVRYRSSDSDQSPVRRDRGSDSDQSPPRKPGSNDVTSHDADKKKQQKTLAGTKAGLQSGKSVRDEIKSIRKRDEQLMKLNADKLGKDAVTQFRRSAKLKQQEEQKEKEEKEKREAILKEKYSKWSKGLKQTEMQQSKLKEDMHEISKPLARYEGDQDLEEFLKAKEDVNDPMYEYMRKKKMKKVQLALKGKPIYNGPPPPPARFNIRPGYRWDGVDRSNGFENKIISQQTTKQARIEEAYKWSVEEM